MDRAVDTVALARRRHPGAPASLDALCKRYSVDNSGRTLHGALLDAQLLAEVYLALMGGRQRGLGLSVVSGGQGGARGWTPPQRPRPLAPRLTDAERAAHEAFVATLGEGALWRKLEG
jgi:DNA polymerase-3 subunit epsilon